MSLLDRAQLDGPCNGHAEATWISFSAAERHHLVRGRRGRCPRGRRKRCPSGRTSRSTIAASSARNSGSLGRMSATRPSRSRAHPPDVCARGRHGTSCGRSGTAARSTSSISRSTPVKSGSSGVPSRFDSTVRLNAIAGGSSCGSSADGSRRTSQSSARWIAASPPSRSDVLRHRPPGDVEPGLVQARRAGSPHRYSPCRACRAPRRAGRRAPLRRCGSSHSRRARTTLRRPTDRPSPRAAPRAAPRRARRNGRRTESIADGSTSSQSPRSATIACTASAASRFRVQLGATTAMRMQAASRGGWASAAWLAPAERCRRADPIPLAAPESRQRSPARAACNRRHGCFDDAQAGRTRTAPDARRWICRSEHPPHELRRLRLHLIMMWRTLASSLSAMRPRHDKLLRRWPCPSPRWIASDT